MNQTCSDNHSWLFDGGIYRKSSMKPPGDLFNYGPSRGGLIERGLSARRDLLTKLSDKDVFGSFSVPLSHILLYQHTTLRLKYINSTRFLSQTILKFTCKFV